MVARASDHPFSTSVIPTPYNPDPALLAIVEIIRGGLIRDQHVRLHQFGTFRLRWSKERRIKHPVTGEYINVPPAPKVTFAPAKHLREWIEPNPKPVIPLDEPVHPEELSKRTETRRESKLKPEIAGLGLPEPENPDHHNLRETVEDIIDEQYNPSSGSFSGIINSQVENKANIEKNTNKKWALGLLAALPLILVILQADFGTEKSVTRTAKQTEFAPESHSQVAAPINNQSIPTEIFSAGTHQENRKDNVDDLVTARPEPTPKPFYMSPQIHTIQKGDNLWKLAEQFYGDPLLWPHIYRANVRTVSDPDIINTGNPLIIPGLQQSPQSLSTKDRELIAEGYFQVYQFNKESNSKQAIYFLIGAKQYSFEWLKQKKPFIVRTDWRVIE